MAYVTKEDGIRDFKAHDDAGYFAYIDKMIINSDFTLTRVPKDPANPGKLDLHSTWKMVPAYINGYVDAYNLKYHATTQSPYAVTDAAKNNFGLTIPSELKYTIPVDVGTGGYGESLVTKNPVTGVLEAPAEAAFSLTGQSASGSKTWYWIIGLLLLVVGFWWWKKRRRK